MRMCGLSPFPEGGHPARDEDAVMCAYTAFHGLPRSALFFTLEHCGAVSRAIDRMDDSKSRFIHVKNRSTRHYGTTGKQKHTFNEGPNRFHQGIIVLVKIGLH